MATTGLWGDRVRQLFKDWKIDELAMSRYQWRQVEHLLTIFDQFDVASTVPADVAEVWDILESYRKSERFRQGVLEGQDQLTLLTVHKSKGLEFEHVIYFWDITYGAPPEQGLMIRTTYNQRYNSPEHVLLYPKTKEKALKNIDIARHILDETKHKQTIERINLHYVALTRAKNHLWIWPYLGEKEADERGDDAQWGGSPAKDNEKLYQLLLQTHGVFAAPTREALPKEAPEQRQGTLREDAGLFAPHIPCISDSVSQLETRIRYAGFSFIKDQEWGNVVHEYLSHIYQDVPEQHQKALIACQLKYGEWLRNKAVLGAIDHLKDWISGHPEWFDSRWRVFTEQLVYHHDAEYRIDRLMVDDQTKEIFIIDYKTGFLRDTSQLDVYEETIKSLDWVKSDGYSVSSQFVEVKLPRP